MAITHVSEATGGAPNSGRMSGTAGDLGAMLAYAVGLQGWATEFSGSNIWVLRPATGNRFRLWVQDDGIVSGTPINATVRGVEGATSTTSVTDPFPQVAQTANNVCTWIKSNGANTTARNFDIFVGDTWLMFFVNPTGASNVWESNFFGDVSSTFSADTYGTIITNRDSSNAAGACLVLSALGNQSATGSLLLNWARTFDGTVKSPYGAFPFESGATGACAAMPIAQSGPSGKIDKRKISVTDCGNNVNGSSVAAENIPIRGYFPNLWMPLHSSAGAVNARDTFADTSYNASASFTTFRQSNSASTPWIIVETTPTWNPPAG